MAINKLQSNGFAVDTSYYAIKPHTEFKAGSKWKSAIKNLKPIDPDIPAAGKSRASKLEYNEDWGDWAVLGSYFTERFNLEFSGDKGKDFWATTGIILDDLLFDGYFGDHIDWGVGFWENAGNISLDLLEKGVGLLIDNTFPERPHMDYWNEYPGYANRVVLYDIWSLLQKDNVDGKEVASAKYPYPASHTLTYNEDGTIKVGASTNIFSVQKSAKVTGHKLSIGQYMQFYTAGNNTLTSNDKNWVRAEQRTDGKNLKLKPSAIATGSGKYLKPLEYIITHPDFETTKYIAFFTIEDKDGEKLIKDQAGWNYFFYCDAFTFRGASAGDPVEVKYGYESLYVNTLSMLKGDTKFKFKCTRDVFNKMQRYVDSALGASTDPNWGYIRSNEGYEQKNCNLHIVTYAGNGAKKLDTIRIVHFKLPKIRFTKSGELNFDHSKFDTMSTDFECVARKVLYKVESFDPSDYKYSGEESLILRKEGEDILKLQEPVEDSGEPNMEEGSYDITAAETGTVGIVEGDAYVPKIEWQKLIDGPASAEGEAAPESTTPEPDMDKGEGLSTEALSRSEPGLDKILGQVAAAGASGAHNGVTPFVQNNNNGSVSAGIRTTIGRR